MIRIYKNTKVKVSSADGDTDYFNIVAGALKKDTLAPYLFIISQDYVLRTSVDIMIEYVFKLPKEITVDKIHVASHSNSLPLSVVDGSHSEL